MPSQAKTAQAALLALDWGTSSLRAYLLSADGSILDVRHAGWGIMRLPEGGFAGALESLCGDWLDANPQLPMIASGMVGSAQGWREVPYAAAPASPDALAKGLREVQGPRGKLVYIVPGVLQEGRKPNVMRGEETQVFGALSLAPNLFGNALEGVIVLPGTHSKWVHVREGRIEAFLTFMTGELFDVLRKHSILGRLMQEDSAGDMKAFELGLLEAADEERSALLSSLFSVRTLGLTQRLHPPQLGDYLSGLLIGHEIREAQHLFAAHLDEQPIALIGAEELCRRYAMALSRFGLAVHGKDFTDATAAGLWQIACSAGLVAKEHAAC
ncbi:MAG TPA: 2-dehydro-3-deoxygalactonokinase [Noviherbaspirillum sp.]